MKSYRMLEALFRGQSAFHAGGHQPDMERGPDSGQYNVETFLPTVPAAMSRHTTQAERASMHPERQDLEWPYCRGPWIG